MRIIYKAIVAVAIIFCLSGCGLKDIRNISDVRDIAIGGNAEGTITRFEKYYPTFESYSRDSELASGYIMYCAAFERLLRLDEYRDCVKRYGKLIDIPDTYDFNVAEYYTFFARRAFEIGDEEAIIKYSLKSLSHDESVLPIFPWEALASVYAHRGDYEKVNYYIDKIDNYRFNAFFGMVTFNEEINSLRQRDALTRIYIELGDSKKAHQIQNRSLREKSVSQSVFEGVVEALNYVESSTTTFNERLIKQGIQQGVKAAIEPDDKGKPKVVDWGFYDRVMRLGMAARVSYSRGDYRHARILYGNLLAEANYKHQKSWYFEAMYDMARMDYKDEKYEKSLDQIVQAIAIVEETMQHLADRKERASFVKKREDAYTVLRNALVKTGNGSRLNSYCAKIVSDSGHSPKGCKI